MMQGRMDDWKRVWKEEQVWERRRMMWRGGEGWAARVKFELVELELVIASSVIVKKQMYLRSVSEENAASQIWSWSSRGGFGRGSVLLVGDISVGDM